MAYATSATTPQERFATCWSDAMIGYANAASAAYWAMTGQALSMWGEAARGVANANTPKEPERAESWYRPEQPVRSALLPSASRPQTNPWGFPVFPDFPSANPFASAGFGGSPFGSQGLGASAFGASGFGRVSPFDVWFDMMPLRGSPAAWPMAFAMLSAGVPKAVAWPTAEANAAMMGAAEAMKQSWNDAMDKAMPDKAARSSRSSSTARYF